MVKLNYGPAKKFLFSCQYLKGREVQIKRRDGSATTGTVVGFGAHGTLWSKIVMWAKVKDNATGKMMQVHLMDLYKTYPLNEPKKSKKQLKAEKKAEAAAAIEEMPSSETASAE